MKVSSKNNMHLRIQEMSDRRDPEYKWWSAQFIKTFLNDDEYKDNYVDDYSRYNVGVLKSEDEFTPQEYRYRMMKYMVDLKDNHNYIISERALEDIDLIKDPIKAIKLLDKLPKEKNTFILNSKEAFRYFIHENNIHMMYLMLGFDGMVHYSVFKIDLSTGQYFGTQQNPGFEWTFENFLRILIFIYYSDQEFVIMPPNKKHGTKKGGSYKNATKVPFTLVNSNWNTTIIRLNEFGVSGHFRLQACGPGRKLRKLIWIQPFKKQGYIRASDKIRNT